MKTLLLILALPCLSTAAHLTVEAEENNSDFSTLIDVTIPSGQAYHFKIDDFTCSSMFFKEVVGLNGFPDLPTLPARASISCGKRHIFMHVEGNIPLVLRGMTNNETETDFKEFVVTVK